jgi:hypothetical protein
MNYLGVIDVNNITTPEIDLNFGVLLFQLEYEATFLVGTMGK